MRPSMNNYYTAAQAIKRLNIPRSTFYYLIKRGEIPEGIIIPLRKQALYSKGDIDKLAEERVRMLEALEHEPERLAFVVPNQEDLEQLREIDLMVFHEETLILPDEQMRRFTYNPEVMHVLKDTSTNTVMGDITMSPLKADVLEKLLALEVDETQIRPEDYLPYTTDHAQDCYVVTIIVRPGLTEKYYASRLLLASLNYLIELLERGVIIRRLYTVATNDDGERLAQSLGFKRLPEEREAGAYEEFRRPYVLDLEAKESTSRLVNRYLRQKKNLERRRKRHAKQDLSK